MDQTVTHWLNSSAGTIPALDAMMVGVTWLGVPVMVLAVALQWWRKADRPYIRHTCVAAGLSFLLGLGLNQAILLFVHRMRPYDAGVSHLIIAANTDWSFPSDHATAAFAIAAAFLLNGLRRSGAGFLIAATVVCLSRVYVGTHYAGDVLGGALTATGAALLIQIAYREGTRVDRFVTRIL